MAEHRRIEETFESPYLGEWDLPDDGKDMLVQIKDVKHEMVNGRNGAAPSEKPVLYFEQGTKKVKPMVLGAKVNKLAIKKALGSSYEDEWVGRKIRLYRELGTWFGETGYAIRIRDFPGDK